MSRQDEKRRVELILPMHRAVRRRRCRRARGVRGHRRVLPGRLRRDLPGARVRVSGALRDCEDEHVAWPGGDGNGARGGLSRCWCSGCSSWSHSSAGCATCSKRFLETVEQLRASDELSGSVGDSGAAQNVQEGSERIADSVPNAISAVLGIAGTFFSGFLICFTIIFTCLFLLSDVSNLKRALGSVLMPGEEERWLNVWERVTTAISRWAIGVVVIAVIAGTTLGLTAALLGSSYAIGLGVLAGLLDMISNIGATIAGFILVPTLWAEEGLAAGIIMLVVLLVYQQVENNVLTPKIQGKAVNLSGFFIIVAVTLFGALLGVLGALTAVPLAASIQIFIQELTSARRERLAAAGCARTRCGAAWLNRAPGRPPRRCATASRRSGQLADGAGVEVAQALVPARRQRVEHDHTQRRHGQDQSGYWLLPRKPSCAMKFSETTTIPNQRAHDCPLSRPRPASTSSVPQISIAQPQPVKSRTRKPSVTTKYSSSKRAIKPWMKSSEPTISIRMPAKPIQPTMLFEFMLPFLPVEDPSIGHVRSI